MHSPPLWTNHTKLYRARGRSNFTLAPPAGLQENYEVERVKDFSSLGGLAAQGGLQNNRSNQLLDGAWSGSTVRVSVCHYRLQHSALDTGFCTDLYTHSTRPENSTIRTLQPFRKRKMEKGKAGLSHDFRKHLNVGKSKVFNGMLPHVVVEWMTLLLHCPGFKSRRRDQLHAY